MMKLDPPGIAISPAGTTATQQLIATYQTLVQYWDSLNDEQRTQELSKATIKNLNVPITDDLVFGVEIVLVAPDGGEGWQPQARRMVGFGSGAFKSAIYAERSLKSALVATHAGRCAYCESYLRHVDHGDVEHFRPKAGVEERNMIGLNRDAYFWLAYEPMNLFLACKICNEVNKGNQFPVLGPRLAAGETDISQEQAVLIHPYVEDPRDFIRFNPVDGRAYPFDLYAAAMMQTGNAPDAETAANQFWRDPTLIDTFPQAPEFQQFLQTAPATLRRGTANIALYHLNRPELVRARVVHLRHLRALLWTASQSIQADDVTEAKKLCAGLIESAQLAPEFVSLTRDAFMTWRVRQEAEVEPRLAQQEVGSIDQAIVTAPWIPNYDQYLTKFEHPAAAETEVDPATYNDYISYYVLHDEKAETRWRRLVYTTDQEKIYGRPGDQTAGIYLVVPWEDDEELQRNVAIKPPYDASGKVEKLGDFLTIDSRNLWRYFSGRDVRVEGPFEAFG